MVLLKKIFGYTLAVVTIGFVLLVIGRMVHFSNLEKTTAVVEKIHSTKLTLADVMGDNLPPDPGEAKDATIAGVDANQNGIRDDVELAVFKQYPKSAKIRAALLQYALVLQMEFTQPVVNKEIVIAVAQESSRASMCIGQLSSRNNIEKFIKVTYEYNDFIKSRQINNKERDLFEAEFLKKIGSYSDLNGVDCDIDFATLPN
jgi:hypothetical protein